MPEPASVPGRERAWTQTSEPVPVPVRAREQALVPEQALVREPGPAQGPAQGPAAKESDLGADSG